MRFQPVAKQEKQQLAQREQEVRKSRDERRTLEASAVDTSNAKPGKQSAPFTAKLPRSPIVAKSSNQLGKDQAPPRPNKVPKPDVKVRPKPEASTPEPNVSKNIRQPEPPKAEYKEKPVPSKPESKPEIEQPTKREAKPEAERPVKREAQPEAVQPSKHEAKPETERPAREKQGESDKGGTRNENKGQENKGEENKGEGQRGPSDK
jgi:hypothetical protein